MRKKTLQGRSCCLSSVLAKTFVTRMMTRDLFAFAYFLVMGKSQIKSHSKIGSQTIGGWYNWWSWCV